MLISEFQLGVVVGGLSDLPIDTFKTSYVFLFCAFWKPNTDIELSFSDPFQKQVLGTITYSPNSLVSN